jgi:hypothetical protein
VSFTGWILALCTCTWVPTTSAEVIVDLRHLKDSQFEQEFFHLERPMSLHIECEGAGDKGDPSLFAYGWLLNAATREVPWVLDYEHSRSEGENRRFDDVIELPAGNYIASYGAFWTGRVRVFRIFDREIFRISGGKERVSTDAMRRWRLVIRTVNDTDDDAVEILSSPPPIGDDRAFVTLAPMGDDEYATEGFTLPERTTFEVVCQGEYVAGMDGPADLGWIQNARTRERVWEFALHNFVHGGGAVKNKVARETITLPAGDYIAGYATDGSHSAAGWNAFPPYDPGGWGLILFANSERVATRIEPFSERSLDAQTIVSLIEQGDYAFSRQGFELKKATDIRIYALGEYDFNNHQFVDQGWVEEFGSGKEVWSMKRRDAVHAGGAPRNLMVEDVVHFEPGRYVVYYTSDDSHSFRRFRSPPPHDPRYWGITLTSADENFDMDNVSLFDADAVDHDALVQLVRVRSGEHVRQNLDLKRTTRLRIVALGEGDYNEMYDYAWIEDRDSGRWVWEMRYRDTRHAGGARKNRLYDRVIELPAGHYEVNYITDDSHAWGDWNRAHPHRPQDWGVTVSLAPE